MRQSSDEIQKTDHSSFDIVGIGSPLLDVFINLPNENPQHKGEAPFPTDRFLTKSDVENLSKLVDQSATFSAAGSVVNSLMALDALGFQTALIGQIGSDANGTRLIDELSGYNIDTQGVNISRTHSPNTGICFVSLDEGGEKTMNSYLGDSLSFEFTEQTKSIVKNGRIVYLEGYLWNSTDGIMLCQKIGRFCKEHGLTLAFNLSDKEIITRGGDSFRSFVEKFVSITFGNTEEYSAFFNHDSFDIKKEWLGEKIEIACITKDKEGSLIYSDGKVHEVPAIPTNCINSTGAGDLYVSGFLGALIKGYDLPTAGKFAGVIASEFISNHPNLKKVAIKKLSRFQDQLNLKSNQEGECQKYAFVA